MSLIGIDLGIHKVTCAVLNGEQLVDVETYEAINRAHRDMELRELGGYVYQLAVLHSVDAAWYEDVLVGNNHKYSIQLAETKGAVLAHLSNARALIGTSIHGVDNGTWKKQVVGNGHASKDEIRNYIHVSHSPYTPLCGDDQDSYDACCIGLYGLHVLEQAKDLRLTEPDELPAG